MNDPRGRQARFNDQSRGQWGGFAGHRRRVSELLAGTGPGRLCVLGAGNANDLDLPALLSAFGEVHLVDLDARALALGAARQGVAGHDRLRLHGGLDLTGLVDAMAGWSPGSTILGAELAALVDWPAGRAGLALPGPFDAVASTCLLSQLVGNAYHSIGEAHPRFVEVVHAIRLGHLRLLAGLAGPAARVALITDVVSTDSAPGLDRLSESEIAALIPRLGRDRGSFHGVAPADLLPLFRSDPVLARRLAEVAITPPWRWRLHDRIYLVVAITAVVKARP